jgi:hypothetical protein
MIIDDFFSDSIGNTIRHRQGFLVVRRESQESKNS